MKIFLTIDIFCKKTETTATTTTKKINYCTNIFSINYQLIVLLNEKVSTYSN